MAKELSFKQTLLAWGVGAAIAAAVMGFGANQIKQLKIDSVRQAAQSAEVQKLMVQSLTNLQTELSSIKYQQAQMSSPEFFQKAVIGAIESYGKMQQAAVTDQKMQSYLAAHESAIGDKWIYGSKDARYTLVEFSDFECPYCKRFHPNAKEAVDQSNGVLNWEWKHMPLGFHMPAAGVEAHAAECVGELAGNRAFWVYMDDIFANTAGNGQGTNRLAQMAVDLGVDGEKFKACMDSGKYQKKVEDDLAMGASLGVQGTPTSFLIDNTTGKRLTLNGAQPAAAIASAVRAMEQAQSEDSGDQKEQGAAESERPAAVSAE